MSTLYEPFEVYVGERTDSIYPIKTEFRGATAEGKIAVELPLLREGELQQALEWLERGFIDHEFAKDLGSRLFETLFPDAIREAFRKAYAAAAPEAGLRIILRLPEKLANLPWELMYDPEGEHGFLARSKTAPLVRHFDQLPIPNEPPQQGPLRILVVTASPPGYPSVSEILEAKTIISIMAGRKPGIGQFLHLLRYRLHLGRSIDESLGLKQLVQVDIVTSATRTTLQRQLDKASAHHRAYHVVHFAGHGLVHDQEPYLLLEQKSAQTRTIPETIDVKKKIFRAFSLVICKVFRRENEDHFLKSNTTEDPITAEEFAELIASSELNLVVLNACQTSQPLDFFNSTALAILKRGVPAVIGMQTRVLDQAAIEFAREFYYAWASGEALESALVSARRLISQRRPGAVADWSIPVLHLGPSQGLSLAMDFPPISLPWPVKILLRLFGSLIAFVSVLGILLSIPDVNYRLRTEVPVIRCIIPYPMSSPFNIIVAEFSVVDERGNLIRGQDGLEFARFLHGRLDNSFGELNLKDGYDIRSPDHTCGTKGRSKKERESNAEWLASRTKAQIIISGVITDTGDQSKFVFEFFVNFKPLEQADELIGQHALGNELFVRLPFKSEEYLGAANLAATERLRVLSFITIGLAYDLHDNLEQAAEFYLKAEQAPGWPPFDSGKALVYLLLGNVNTRLSAVNQDAAYLAEGQNYYQKALREDSQYARAQVGYATTLYLDALGNPSNPLFKDFGTVKWDQLDKAASEFEYALRMKNQPTTANIDAKVHFYLGQIYLVRAQGQSRAEQWVEAEREFYKVISAYENDNSRLEDWAGHAYARLGLIELSDGRIVDGFKHLRLAIKLVSPHYQAAYQEWLGEAYCLTGNRDLALKAYEDASRIAHSNGDLKASMKYADRLKELKATPSSCIQK